MTCYDYILFVLRVVYNVVVLFWVESVGDQIYPLSLFFFFFFFSALFIVFFCFMMPALISNSCTHLLFCSFAGG